MSQPDNPEQLSPISRRAFFKQIGEKAAGLGALSAIVALGGGGSCDLGDVLDDLEGVVYSEGGYTEGGGGGGNCGYCDGAGRDYYHCDGNYCDYINYSDGGGYSENCGYCDGAGRDYEHCDGAYCDYINYADA